MIFRRGGPGGEPPYPVATEWRSKETPCVLRRVLILTEPAILDRAAAQLRRAARTAANARPRSTATESAVSRSPANVSSVIGPIHPIRAGIQAEGHFFGDLIGSRFQSAIACTRAVIRRRIVTL